MNTVIDKNSKSETKILNISNGKLGDWAQNICVYIQVDNLYPMITKCSPLLCPWDINSQEMIMYMATKKTLEFLEVNDERTKKNHKNLSAFKFNNSLLTKPRVKNAIKIQSASYIDISQHIPKLRCSWTQKEIYSLKFKKERLKTNELKIFNLLEGGNIAK